MQRALCRFCFSLADHSAPARPARLSRHDNRVHALILPHDLHPAKARCLQVLPQLDERKRAPTLRRHQHIDGKQRARHRPGPVILHQDVTDRDAPPGDQGRLDLGEQRAVLGPGILVHDRANPGQVRARGERVTSKIAGDELDALFQPTHPMREIVRHVGETNDLPENWLNDAAKSFVSARHETVMGNLPQFPHLRLTMPTPEYLLAMKCMASRIGALAGETDDVADIVFLIRQLKLKDAKAVMDIVAAYYPKDKVPVKAQYLVEGLFAEGKV